MIARICLILLLLVILSCKAGPATSKSDFQPEFSPGPATLVYKTKQDYRNLVPVMLSDDKATITSYPHPSDVRAQNAAQPTALQGGYLLDNRGIGRTVAFLRLTYKEYSELNDVPSLADLDSWIIDRDPLTELCDCGNRKKYSDVSAQLNEAISRGVLVTKCKVLLKQ